MATPIWNIFTLLGTEAMSFRTLMNTLANSVETGISASVVAGNRVNPSTVANQAARDTLFPSPVQGNRVFRVDKGWTEGYFTTPAVASNGWYPIDGALPTAVLRPAGGSAQSLTTGVYTQIVQMSTSILSDINVSGGVMTINTTGLYRVSGFVPLTASSAGRRIGIITRNGTVWNTGAVVYDEASPGGGFGAARPSVSVRLVAGDVLRLFVMQSSGGTLNVLRDADGSDFAQVASGSEFSATYIRPA